MYTVYTRQHSVCVNVVSRRTMSPCCSRDTQAQYQHSQVARPAHMGLYMCMYTYNEYTSEYVC